MSTRRGQPSEEVIHFKVRENDPESVAAIKLKQAMKPGRWMAGTSGVDGYAPISTLKCGKLNLNSFQITFINSLCKYPKSATGLLNSCQRKVASRLESLN